MKLESARNLQKKVVKVDYIYGYGQAAYKGFDNFPASPGPGVQLSKPIFWCNFSPADGGTYGDIVA